MTGTDQEIGQTKRCTKCLEWMSTAEFNIDRSRRDGLQDRCRPCRNAAKRERHAKDPLPKREADRRYREANKAEIAEYQKTYREERKEELSEKKREYHEKNKEDILARGKEKRKLRTEAKRQADIARSKKWHEENKEYSALKVREWHEKNPEIVREVKKRYKKKRLSTAKGKLEANVSRGIRRGLKPGAKGGISTFELLGYSVEDLKSHLEKQFHSGMTWENYGKWHIDHIIPLTAFNYDSPDQLDFKRCWALDNLQPMWGLENMSKNNRLTAPFQPSLHLSMPG